MNYRTLIDVETLSRHLDDADWVVLDCRFNLMDTEAGRRAWHEGHIPGARYVHLDEQLSSAITPASGRHPLPDPQQLAQWFAAIGIGSSTQVVVCDDMGGAMAGRCWWLLRTLGHDAVAVLDGGYPQWQQAGLPISTDDKTTTAVAVAESDFSGCWDSDAVVTAEQVQAGIEQPQFVLVDARTPERYRGEQEPIDPVAGHVPGALNRALQLNLDTDGRFKPAAQLREEWMQLMAGHSADQLVHMCGSGVTACHNQLAMEHAGLTGSRIYAGSWSEWIRDPRRPVATG